jgi:hypothetical protein
VARLTLAMSLYEPASSPGVGAIAVNDPALTAELVDVAELCVNSCRCKTGQAAKSGFSRKAMGCPMNPSNRDRAAIAAAFERADAIVALAGFVPDDGYRAIQRRVVAGELTSDQAVQLVIAQAQAAERAQASGPAEAA